MTKTSKYPNRGVWNSRYANRWEEAMVSGNGKQGVMVFGNPKQETIIGNHCRLYLPKGDNEFVPNMAPYLGELRKIIAEEGYEKAKTYYYQKAKELGYQGLTMSDPFHPGFHMYIQTEVEDYYDYTRSTDFETGEITIDFVDNHHVHHQRKTFVSRADDVIVHSMKNSSNDVSCEINVQDYKMDLIDHLRKIDRNAIHLSNEYIHSEGGYEVSIRIEALDGEVNVEDQSVIIDHAKEVLLMMKIITFKTKEDRKSIDFKDLYLLNAHYDELLDRHQKIHSEIFNRVNLQLAPDKERKRNVEDLIEETKQTDTIPLALMEKLYDAGRYMFICSARELSPNLQGLWTGTFEPAWSGDFTFDTNVQLSIASALSCNLHEGLHGFFRLISEFMPEFRENARLYYGCRGIMSSAHSSNSGKHFHWNEEWPLQFWTCGAGWLGHWYYQYYLHTGDKQFLAEQVIPYLRECALFYEDFLVEDSDGTYRFTPSYSAENGCGDNSTQDIAVAKEVLRNLIQAHKELGIESPDIAKWENMLQKLPKYMINDEGILKEWAIEGKDENYNHRHFSHLYPIFQSREFTQETDPALWEASKRAFNKRLDAWLRNPDADTSSTHGRMHAALCATQFGEKDLIYEIFQMMIKNNSMYSTLMTSHYNNKEVFNVDGNGAIPQIINEMIIDGVPGKVKVLQALPDQLSQGKIEGVSLAQQIKVEKMTWDLENNHVHLSISSKIDQEVEVELPLFPNSKIEKVSNCHAANQDGQWFVQLIENQITELHISLE